MKTEKRRWPRVAFSIQAHLTVEGEDLEVQCLNLSMNGMYALSPSPLPVGAAGQVTISQDMEPDVLLVHARYEVARSEEEQDGHCLGLRLMDVDADSSINLYHIVRNNTPD